MDQKVKDIERAKFWKAKGYEFDPDYMTAWSMDQAVAQERNQGGTIALPPDHEAILRAYQTQSRLRTAASSAVAYDPMDSDEGDDSEIISIPTRRALQPLPVLDELDADENPSLGDKTKRGVYLGQLGGNEFNPNSTKNPFGAGNEFNPNSIKNDFGIYGNEFSPHSPRNPYATDTPKLYDSQGNYRGKLSSNPYDPDSISNPYGRYGNPFSPDSIKNPYGAGNPFSPDSPKNPFGQGLSIYGDE